MFSSPIFDLVIALSFTYFLLSIIVSGIHEFIFSVLKRKRADFLKTSINHLFFDEEWKKLAGELGNSPHLQSLISAKGLFPSYIPAKNFAMFLMDQMRNGNLPLDMKQVEVILTTNTSGSLLEGEVKKMLLSLFERSEGSLQKFQTQIEQYFDASMDRAAGVYKKNIHKWMLLISLVVALITNADTLHITQVLWDDKKQLSTMADNMGKAVSANQNGDFKFTAQKGDSLETIFAIHQVDTILVDTTSSIPKVIHKSTEAISYLQSEGIPLGWTKKEFMLHHGFWSWGLMFIEKLIGLSITTMALSLGAPFWFDLLNKFVNLRAAGKKPATEADKK